VISESRNSNLHDHCLWDFSEDNDGWFGMSRKESSDEAVKIDRITIVREGGRDKLRQ
jgi:hypothetical protein